MLCDNEIMLRMIEKTLRSKVLMIEMSLRSIDKYNFQNRFSDLSIIRIA